MPSHAGGFVGRRRRYEPPRPVAQRSHRQHRLRLLLCTWWSASASVVPPARVLPAKSVGIGRLIASRSSRVHRSNRPYQFRTKARGLRRAPHVPGSEALSRRMVIPCVLGAYRRGRRTAALLASRRPLGLAPRPGPQLGAGPIDRCRAQSGLSGNGRHELIAVHGRARQRRDRGRDDQPVQGRRPPQRHRPRSARARGDSERPRAL